MIARLKPGRLAFVGLALAIGLAACGTSSSNSSSGKSTQSANSFSDPTQGVTASSLSWGLIYDQTGPTASTQVPFGDGFLSAIKAANAAGGVNGRTINVVPCDEQYAVAPAMACLKNMLSNQPVVGLTGLNNSSFQAAALPIVQQNKLPVIGPESTNKEIVNPFPQYVWATECSYPSQADVAVAWAIKKLGKSNFTAVGLGGNVASANEYLGEVQQRVQKAGGKYLQTVYYSYTAPNMNQQAQQIAALKPDVIFTHGGTAQNVEAFKALQQAGVTNALVIGIFAQETATIAQASPAVGANYYAINCWNTSGANPPGAAAMVKAAKAAGYASSIYDDPDFTNGYVNGLLVVHALKLAGSKPTRVGINKVMPTITNFTTGGLSPTISFGPNNSYGMTAVAPFKYNYSTGVWEIQGTFSDYAKCDSHEYTTGNINAWSPSCIG